MTIRPSDNMTIRPLDKKVLVICYHYPPSPHATPYPTRSWVKYLPKFGWQPIVLTRNWNTDTYVKDINTNCIVYKTPYKEYFGKIVKLQQTIRLKIPLKAGLLNKPLNFILLNFIFHPDSERGWYPYAYRAGLSIIKEHPISVILSVGAPWTDHWIASNLHKRTGIPWIADYRDPWTQDISIKRSKKWFIRDKVHRVIEKKNCQSASCFIHASKIWTNQLSQLLGIKGHTIPNGFDPEDFTNLPEYNLRLNLTNSEIFTLSYIGTLHFTQKLDVFFIGFKEFILENRISPENCKIRFVGTGSIEILHNLRSNLFKSVDRYVEFIPCVPKNEAIKYMLQSHVLLLFLNDDRGWYPTKLFEYLACCSGPVPMQNISGAETKKLRQGGRQILATPDNGGVVKELLDETHSGITLNTSSEVANWLKEKYKNFIAQSDANPNDKPQILPPQRDPEKSGTIPKSNMEHPAMAVIDKFSRVIQTHKLAQILNYES
ncbi:MAG: hypothetical protein HY769_04760 [Candidatus Stahlbacteria bacterium]|nr:hypothetical protein [Candidatus Stahlbacteria bacterium]